MRDQRLEPRRVSISEFQAMERKYRAWHLYGPDDELGAANRVTPGDGQRGPGGSPGGGITGDPDRDPVSGAPCPDISAAWKVR
jgi:hypothetical protein